MIPWFLFFRRQVIEYKKKENTTPRPKPRTRRVLFADEVQQPKKPTNGYSTQSLPRSWGKSNSTTSKPLDTNSPTSTTPTKPVPQVRKRNGYFYLESTSPDKHRPVVNNRSRGGTSRDRYSSLPNMTNGTMGILSDSKSCDEVFYSVNDFERNHREQMKLRSASMQVLKSLNNQVHQRKQRPVERSASFTHPRELTFPYANRKVSTRSESSLPNTDSPGSGSRKASLETLHEDNEADDSPITPSNDPPILTGGNGKHTENTTPKLPASNAKQCKENTTPKLTSSNAKRTENTTPKRNNKVKRSNSLNTYLPPTGSDMSSFRDKNIHRLIKRFQQKIQEADNPKADESHSLNSLKLPDVVVIPAMPETETPEGSWTENQTISTAEKPDTSQAEPAPKNTKDENRAEVNSDVWCCDTNGKYEVENRTAETQQRRSQHEEEAKTLTSETVVEEKTQNDVNSAADEQSDSSATYQPSANSCCCSCHHHHHHHNIHHPDHHPNHHPNHHQSHQQQSHHQLQQSHHKQTSEEPGFIDIHMLRYINTPPAPNLNR